MAEFPAMPLWTDRYLADTRHLNRAQHGSYLLLLMEAWRRPRCSLPDDDDLLAKLAGCTEEEWRSDKSRIMSVWTLDRRRKEWVQKGQLKERAYVAKNSKAQSDKARKRWDSRKKGDTAALPDPCPVDAPTPTPTPTPTLLPSEEDMGGGGRARGFFTRIVVAAGMNPADVLPTYWMPPKAEVEVLAWLDLPGMTEDLAERHVIESTRAKGRANGPRAFTNGLRALSAQLIATPLQPIAPPEGGTTHGRRASPADPDRTQRVIDGAVARFRAGRT